MDKKYKNVAEMIRNTVSDTAAKELALKEISEKKISKLLFTLRCQQKLTQKDVAEKLKCTQGRISKIENSYDCDLSVKDLLDYALALNLRLEIGYRHPFVKLTDLIKYHAFKIQAYLAQLNSLAKEDTAMKDAVAKFHIETIVNVARLVAESFLKLGVKIPRQTEEQNIVHTSLPLEAEETVKK
jgi:transcriptional regulator with XRE-family HTH domain